MATVATMAQDPGEARAAIVRALDRAPAIRLDDETSPAIADAVLRELLERFVLEPRAPHNDV